MVFAGKELATTQFFGVECRRWVTTKDVVAFQES